MKKSVITLEFIIALVFGVIILLALLYPLKGFSGILFGSPNPTCLSEEAKNIIDRISSTLDGLNIGGYGDDVIRLDHEDCAFVLYSKEGELKTPPEEVFQKSAICVCEYDNNKCTENRYCKEIKDANVLVDMVMGTDVILFNKVQLIPIYFKRETDRVLFSTKSSDIVTALTNALTNSLVNSEGKMSVLLQGQPSISVDVIKAELEKYNSPAKDYADLIYNLGIEYGIDPSIALAFFFKESNYGTKGVATITKGFGNMRPGSSWTGEVYVSPNSGSFRKYNSWEDSIRDWYELIKNSNNYVGSGKTTIEEIVPVYAPSSENDVSLYIKTVRSQVVKYQETSGLNIIKVPKSYTEQELISQFGEPTFNKGENKELYVTKYYIACEQDKKHKTKLDFQCDVCIQGTGFGLKNKEVCRYSPINCNWRIRDCTGVTCQIYSDEKWNQPLKIGAGGRAISSFRTLAGHPNDYGKTVYIYYSENNPYNGCYIVEDTGGQDYFRWEGNQLDKPWQSNPKNWKYKKLDMFVGKCQSELDKAYNLAPSAYPKIWRINCEPEPLRLWQSDNSIFEEKIIT